MRVSQALPNRTCSCSHGKRDGNWLPTSPLQLPRVDFRSTWIKKRIKKCVSRHIRFHRIPHKQFTYASPPVCPAVYLKSLMFVMYEVVKRGKKHLLLFIKRLYMRVLWALQINEKIRFPLNIYWIFSCNLIGILCKNTESGVHRIERKTKEKKRKRWSEEGEREDEQVDSYSNNTYT